MEVGDHAICDLRLPDDAGAVERGEREAEEQLEKARPGAPKTVLEDIIELSALLKSLVPLHPVHGLREAAA